jgi:low temperature requirement protein LtrA
MAAIRWRGWRGGTGALAIESSGALVFYRVPGLGRSTPDDWAIAGGHMAERCALFIIIALGEGVLITGATFGGSDRTRRRSRLPQRLRRLLRHVVGLFRRRRQARAEHIEHHDRPGLVGRNAFTYWHIPIVAGIILLAVADELTLAIRSSGAWRLPAVAPAAWCCSWAAR